MVLINKQARVVIIPVPQASGGYRDHQLGPGVNFLPDDELRRLVGLDETGRRDKKLVVNPTIQLMLDEGQLEIPEDQPEDDGTIAGMSIPKAREYIGKVYSLDTLRNYLETEQRPRVRQAVQEQLDKIQTAKEKKQADSEDEG